MIKVDYRAGIAIAISFWLLNPAIASDTAVRGLIERIAPGHAGNFIIEEIPAPAGQNVFEVDSRDGKIVLRGDGPLSQAVAFNWYLKHTAFVSVSWYLEDAVTVPEKLPLPAEMVRRTTRLKDRFFLNYCTFGYTMPFYHWDQWERLVDWMALEGINLPLAQNGNEYVWQKVWRDYGLSDDEIRTFFTGPAHLPWNRMLNIDWWQGPLPQSYIDAQHDLQKKIVARERELGMSPVLCAFAGHVPPILKQKHPEFHLQRIPPGWAGMPEHYACWFLSPTDPKFKEIQVKFLKAQQKEYGASHYYGTDPFNEIQPPSWEPTYLADTARAIYGGMAAVDPQAAWLQMAWTFHNDHEHWTAPRLSAMIRAVPQGRMLLIDYVCEKEEIYKTTDAFCGAPFLWDYLGNFGGNTQIVGPLGKINRRLTEAMNNPKLPNLSGVGATLEGLNNPVDYEMLFERPWQGEKMDVAAWVRDAARARAGGPDEKVEQAWELLRKKVLLDDASSYWGHGVVYQLSDPSLRGNQWLDPAVAYDNRDLFRIWDLLLQAGPAARKSSAYRRDLLDVSRQALGNLGLDLRAKMAADYNEKDTAAFAQAAAEFMTLGRDIDALLACKGEFMLGKWIADAKSWAADKSEEAYYERNARTIITVWSRPSILVDYAGRQWNGLIRDYYLPRWQMFIDATIDELKTGNPTNRDELQRNWRAFEWQFATTAGGGYAAQPQGDTYDMSRAMFAKYAPLALGGATADASSAAKRPVLHLVPTPKEIKVSSGTFILQPTARIVAASGELKPLAEVLRGDMLKLTGLNLETAVGTGRSGDIVLAIDPALTDAETRHWPHRVTVSDRVEIAGGDYNAAALGTATLLQLLDIAAIKGTVSLSPIRKSGQSSGGVSIPHLAISDYSAAAYPGVMLDVARQNNTLQDVRDCIDLCRLYKVRYFHLHLNDMESFVFPSKLFPKLGTHNRSAHGGPKCELWDRDELLATIKYADERGVTLVPELETVFHTGAMMQDMPEVFGGPGVLNMGSEKLYRSLNPLIEEICDVFKSSPYFQIGCDEASIGGVLQQPGTREYMLQHGIANGEDLYRFHIDRLAKVIARKGKRTIVWQDCPLPRDNKNIICMVWHIDYNHGDTAPIMRAGYPTIQVTWTPACGSPVKELFSWRPFDEQIAPGTLALGSQLVLWEQNGSVAMPYLRQKVPARQQVTYSPDADITDPQFAANLAHTDALLDRLYSGINVTETGLTQTVPEWLAAGGVGLMPDYTFDKPLELALTTNVPGAKIRYTVTQIPKFNPSSLYGKAVTADSPVATGPIPISPPEGEAIAVEARLFDDAGNPLGGESSRTYRWQPYVVGFKGTVAEGDYRFGKAVEISLRSSLAEGTVRYAVGGRLTASSPVFDKPFTMEKSGEVTVGYFDAQNKPRGLVWRQQFRKVDFDPTNITYKKPVIRWGSSTKQAAEVAVDGIVDHEQFLDIQPAPQQFAVDLLESKTLDKIVLYTYWDGGRYYQYKIDVSTDRRQWTTVADAAKNHTVATAHGYAHTFPPVSARYIRVTMLRNSANPGLHIVELRAYEAKR